MRTHLYVIPSGAIAKSASATDHSDIAMQALLQTRRRAYEVSSSLKGHISRQHSNIQPINTQHLKI